MRTPEPLAFRSRSWWFPGAVLGVCGCLGNGGPGPVSAQNPDPPIDPPSEVNVQRFGAVGDDLVDDTRAIEAAIASLSPMGGSVLVPSGTYLLTAFHTSPYRALDLSGLANVAIRGEGAGRTILKMAPGTYQGSISTILIANSSGISIRNLTVDGNRGEVFYGDEQSHTLSVVSSTGVTLDGVEFINTGGDGVRLLGAPVPGDPWTDGVRIENSRFADTWRNGISIQRAVRNVDIIRNTFLRVSDQSISSEPSGQGGPTDILVEDNVIHHSTGNWAVAMAGINTGDVLQRVVFQRNRVENGGVYFLQTSHLSVTGNDIVGDAWHPPLRLHDIELAVVSGNEMVSSYDGDGALQIVNDGNNLPGNVTVEDNLIEVGDGMTGLFVRDAMGGITIRGNGIRGHNGHRGIQVENVIVTGSSRSAFAVDDNVIENFRYAIHFSTRGDLFSGLEINGNDISHDQSQPTDAIGIALVGFPFTGDVRMLSNSFGQGVTRTICIISGNESC